MYGKKYYEANCGEFRRDCHHFSNGFGSKYCANCGNLMPANHFAQESEIWNPFECTFGSQHIEHHHTGHTGHHHHNYYNPHHDQIGSSVHHHHHHHQHQSHHGFYGHYEHHHRPTETSVDQGGLSGGNVNELSATPAEHVINLYDLCANRDVDYADCSFNEQMGHHTANSLAYNQEDDYYCCANLEDPPPPPMSWREADSCRTWESNQNHEALVGAMPPNQHFGPHSGHLVMAFGNQPNAFEAASCVDNISGTRCDRDKFAIHKPPTGGPSFPPGSGVFARQQSNYMPFKEYKAMGPSAVSLNLAMNVARPRSLVENNPAMSSIQMHTHSKYKLMSQLGEHITIKEHNFTDVYRINKEGGNLRKAKSTLYSQMKHILIDRVEQNAQPSPPNRIGKCPLASPTSVHSCGSTSRQERPSEDKANLCFICGKNYARPSTLKTHLRTHSGEKPFKCNICSKSFSQVANLTAHERTHSGEKPFPCLTCGRRFSQSSSVKTHERTHSGERPYICQFCHHSFSDSSTLKKHLRIHSGEKPYQCRHCFLRFSQSGNRSRHERSSHFSLSPK